MADSLDSALVVFESWIEHLLAKSAHWNAAMRIQFAFRESGALQRAQLMRLLCAAVTRYAARVRTISFGKLHLAEHVAPLARALACTHITSLNLHANRLRSAHLTQSFQYLPKTIRALDLSFNEIDNVGKFRCTI